LLSKSQIKLITSLQQKKYRDKTGLFIAEGPKVIRELIGANFRIHSLFASEEIDFKNESTIQVTASSLQKASALKTANKVLAVFEIPKEQAISEKGITIALDAIRDPGNLGTIIRLCDWFGVPQLICSKDTVDCFNPKVIQASMGSITRVNVAYRELSEYISQSNVPIYGGFMNQENIYKMELASEGIIVLGNEANGISKDIETLVNHKISIPQFGEFQETESLNVATATAILLSEFKRFTER